MKITDIPVWALQLVFGIVGFYVGIFLAVSFLGVSFLAVVLGLVIAVVVGFVGAKVTQQFAMTSS
jgi:uncharacterized membrane protein